VKLLDFEKKNKPSNNFQFLAENRKLFIFPFYFSVALSVYF